MRRRATVSSFLEQRDPVVEAEIGAGAGDVGDQRRARSPRHGHGRIGADLGAGVDVLGEQRAHRAVERVDLGAVDDVGGARA